MAKKEAIKKIEKDNKAEVILETPMDKPGEELDVDKQDGLQKFILETDSPKSISKVTNTGKYEGKDIACDKAGKPVARVQCIKGRAIHLKPGETILVSASLVRFFSEAKGYTVERA